MRAKTAARGGRKSSTPSTSASPQRFNLGELVICRYSTYPYWPATIDQTHQARYKGAHVLKRRTRRGEKVLSYWCTFSNEDTGGWVRHDRITRYHPDIVPKIRLDESDEFFDDQAEALNVAQRAYAALPASARSHKPPARLPKDFSANVAVNSDDEDMLKSDADEDDADDDDDDDDNAANEQKEKTPSKPANSRAKRRGSSRPSSKRNGASAPAPTTAQAARESDDEMDLGDDSDDELGNPDDHGNDKEEAKVASRKPAKRARLSTPPQSNRRTSTTSTGKAQPSTARTTRTSVTPKKEPRRTSAKRKSTVAPPVSRERKRNKTSSQNSVPPAPPKRTTSEPQADENALEIPIPNEEPSSDATPIVKKKFNSVSKPSTLEKSSDSEHDDQSSPEKQPPSKSATNNSPSSSKKQLTGKESTDAIKETSKGSENKELDPKSKSEVKSPSSDPAKSSSSSAADDLDRDVSKLKDDDESSDKDKSRSKSQKEDDHSSVKSSGSLSTARKKSDGPNIILGRDQIDDPVKKAPDAHILLPKVDVIPASKGSGSSLKSEQKDIEGKDGEVDPKGAEDPTVKIDVFKGDHDGEEDKPDNVKIKIVEGQPESESPSASKDRKRTKSVGSGKKDEGSTEPDGNVKSSKASSLGNSGPSKGHTLGGEKPSRDVGTSVRRLPKGSGTSPKRISGTTSDNRKSKPHDVPKDSSPSKTEVENELNKDSEVGLDSAPKEGKDTGFVKIDIKTKPGKQEKPHDPPEVKTLNTSRDTAAGKTSSTADQKPVASDGSGPEEVDSSGIEEQTEHQTLVHKDDSEVVAEAEHSSPANKSEVAKKNAIAESLSVTKGVKAVNTGIDGDNKEGDITAEKSTANDTEGPGATLSNASRPTTGAKQPIMVKVAPSRPASSTEEGNKASKGNSSRPTVHDKSTDEVASKPEKSTPSAEAERLAKMSENSAIQAGIAAEGVQEDITPESFKDIGSTDVKRQTTSDTTEMDVVMESPGSTVEELKDQLERARLTIGKLRSKLKASDEPRGGKNIGATSLATFVMPIAPDNLQLALPSQNLYMSDPVDADRFVDVVQHIRKTFDNFKTRVKAAEVARIELQSQAVELRKRYEEKCEAVLKAEEEAVMEERELIDILKKLLIYKVSAAELKKHKAGNLVRSIGKTCKQMPAVANICEEIYVTWRSHFLRHLVSSTEKSKEGGEHESDGLELSKKDETEKSEIGEKPGVDVSVKPVTKASPEVEKKAEDGRNKENENVDHAKDEGNSGGNDNGGDDNVEGTGDDVDMEDAGEDNGDDMDMDDDESGDDDEDDDDDDDALEKKSGDANDADDDDDLE